MKILTELAAVRAEQRRLINEEMAVESSLQEMRRDPVAFGFRRWFRLVFRAIRADVAMWRLARRGRRMQRDLRGSTSTGDHAMARTKAVEPPHPAADQITLAETAYSVLQEEQPGMSIDTLLINPIIGLEICRIVRKQLGKKDDDPVILRALLNGRKRGLIRPGIRRRWRKS